MIKFYSKCIIEKQFIENVNSVLKYSVQLFDKAIQHMVLCTKINSSVLHRIGNILTIYQLSSEKCNDKFYCDKNNNSALCLVLTIIVLPLFSLQDYYYEDNA